jgi:dual-specificity kinase
MVPSAAKDNLCFGKSRKVLLSPEIRVIDFGCAVFNYENHPPRVGTPPYRAPEIILHLGWSFPCDIWSIGCILMEMFTGDAVFDTDEDVKQLAMIEEVVERKFNSEALGPENPARSYFKEGVIYPVNGFTPMKPLTVSLNQRFYLLY